MTLTSDTAGQTLTCSVTSAGGSAQGNVTIRRDATAPAVAGSRLPAANLLGWNNSEVTVSFAGVDGTPGSGLANCTPGVVLSTEGSGLSASGVCTDVAGNVSALAMVGDISIDRTAPVATIQTPANAGSYAQASSVLASYSCSDSRAGVATCAGSVANGSAIDTAAVGAATFTVNAVDRAGNAGTASASYTVTPSTVDTTPPTVTAMVNGTLGDNGWYRSSVAISWTVVDGESALTSQTGCGPVTVTQNTSGQTFRCTAKSAGGTTTREITIKKDTALPLAAALSPLNGAKYPRGLAVPALYACVDLRSSIAECDATVALGHLIDTATRGAKSFSLKARDQAGNERTLAVSYSVF